MQYPLVCAAAAPVESDLRGEKWTLEDSKASGAIVKAGNSKDEDSTTCLWLLHNFLFSLRMNNRALGLKLIVATSQLLKSVLHRMCIDSALVASVFISIANVNISATCKDIFINSVVLIFLTLQTHLSLCY